VIYRVPNFNFKILFLLSFPKTVFKCNRRRIYNSTSVCGEPTLTIFIYLKNVTIFFVTSIYFFNRAYI